MRIRRKVVFDNLQKALPQVQARHHQIAQNAYRHFGISAMEFFKMSRLKPGEFTKIIRCIGMEHFDSAFRRGRGVIVITAHYGNFDLLCCSQAHRGVPLGIVSRDLHSGGVNRFWMQARKKCGLKVFPEKGAAKSLVGWLRQGNVLGLTVDQRTSESKGGILVDFLGWQVWTTTAPAALAIASGAAIVPIRLERRSDGLHDLIVHKELEFLMSNKKESIYQLTRRINEVIGSWICQRPDQWMWLHRRFIGATQNHDLESCTPKG